MTKKAANPESSPVLVVEGLSVVSEQGVVAVDDVSFTVRSGEIVAVAGVQGNGQTELVEALLGLRSEASGTIVLNGENLTDDDVRSRLQRGIGYVPEDRKKDGLVGEFSVGENLMLDRTNDAAFTRGSASVSLDEGSSARMLLICTTSGRPMMPHQ